MTESLAERTCAAQRFDFAETFRFQYLLSRDAEGRKASKPSRSIAGPFTIPPILPSPS